MMIRRSRVNPHPNKLVGRLEDGRVHLPAASERALVQHDRAVCAVGQVSRQCVGNSRATRWAGICDEEPDGLVLVGEVRALSKPKMPPVSPSCSQLSSKMTLVWS